MEEVKKTLAGIAEKLREEADKTSAGAEMQDVLASALEEMAVAEQEILGLEIRELTKWKKEKKRWTRVCSVIFQELESVSAAIKDVVASLNEDERFGKAPLAVRDRLHNRKEGLEIICRMLDRIPPRKAKLDELMKNARTSLQRLNLSPGRWVDRLNLGAAVEEIRTQVKGIAEEIEEQEEGSRDANYDLIRETRLEAENIRRGVTDVIKDQVLPVIDGLERGLWDEDKLKEPLKPYRDEEDLIEQWFDAYRGCYGLMKSYLKKVGVRCLNVKPGMEFDPTLHIALGTESSSKFEDGKVLEVLRSGWQVLGLPVRPTEVLVVKNREGDGDGA
jgi:molecular chaperone GrpE (heat shock protein)